MYPVYYDTQTNQWKNDGLTWNPITQTITSNHLTIFSLSSVSVGSTSGSTNLGLILGLALGLGKISNLFLLYIFVFKIFF